MKSRKILLAAAVMYFGISDAQQSQYFTQKENYRFNLAENLYQTQLYSLQIIILLDVLTI